MPKNDIRKKKAKKRARKLIKKEICKKQQQALEKKALSKTTCHVVSVTDEQKMISLVSNVFKRYHWEKFLIYPIKLTDKDSGYAKIRVRVAYLKSKDTFDFILSNKFKIIHRINGNPYRILYCVGKLEHQKDTMLLENFICREIQMKRKGDESEYLATTEIKRLLPPEYILRCNRHLDALSIDILIQKKGSLDEFICFQVKSSIYYIKKSKKEFERKKYQMYFDENPFFSIIKNNILHFIIVIDNMVFALDKFGAKIPLEKYLKEVLKRGP
jgi:hypothetical protein